VRVIIDKGGGNAVADKPSEKRDEFQAFKSLTAKLVAVPRGEITARKPKRRARRRNPK
jgi:hypothetical protein